jgi:tRNA threonylcarbamoyladenosine biosynthesis protein TsaE
VIISKSVEETRAIGARIGKHLRAGTVLALHGDLGSGKTCMVQGIAAGLGVSSTACVNSPTFVLINEYDGPIPLYHFDLYRLADGSELIDLGWEDYLDSQGVIAIEWAERMGSLLPPDHIGINLEITGESSRRITFTGKDLE